MKRIFLGFFLLLPALLHAQQLELALPNAQAPSISAKNYLLYDVQSNQILAAKDAHERIEPASLTKLMTAYIVFSAIEEKKMSLMQTVRVSERAWRAEGSRMFVEPKKPVTVEELLHGVIIDSGNDASIALAEAGAGSEDAFAELMNKEAQRLGMKDTHFVNATGLPHPEHYSSAYDLALLSAAVIRNHPEFYSWHALKEYRYNNILQPNRNRLLWLDPYVDGIKTGHTDTAGYCLIASAKRGERRLISVVLNTASDNARTMESQKLLNYGFQAFDTVRLYQKQQPVAMVQVWKGAQNTVKAGFASDLFITLPKGDADRLKASLESQQPLIAPVAAGQSVGTMKIALDGKPVASFSVVALETVALGNFLARAWDSMRLWLK